MDPPGHGLYNTSVLGRIGRRVTPMSVLKARQRFLALYRLFDVHIILQETSTNLELSVRVKVLINGITFSD